MPDAVQPGRLLDGRYRVIDRFGHGGMSTVWRARDERLGRIVAVKVLDAEVLADPGSLARLRTEAQSLARLRHPHIADVYDYGTDDVPFLVMELVDGVPLAAALADGRPLPWIEAVSVSAQVAAALATAHRRGVVHRDIAAGNILLTRDGVKVIDFGICAPEGNLEGGTLLGTPAYLAPERIIGRPVQPESDVYAVGVLLYRMVSGAFPFLAATAEDVMRAHRDLAPPRLPTIAGMPDAVAQLCMRCLEKDPADRPSAADLARTLFDVVGGAVTLPVPPLEAADDAMPTHLLPWLDGPPPRDAEPAVPGRRFGTRARTTMAAAGVLLAIGAAWTVNGWNTSAATPRAAAVPAPAQPAVCTVTYRSLQESGGSFAAEITVANSGERDIADARLTFELPETQQLSASGYWQRSGRAVSTMPGQLSLPRGGGVRLPLAGTYVDTVGYPVSFLLDGKPCTVFVYGPGGTPIVTPSAATSQPPVVVVAPSPVGPGSPPSPGTPPQPGTTTSPAVPSAGPSSGVPQPTVTAGTGASPKPPKSPKPKPSPSPRPPREPA